MKKLAVIISIISVAFLFSCKNANDNNAETDENAANLNEAVSDESKDAELVLNTIDLSEKMIPITMDVPKGAEVSEGMLNGDFGGVNLINYEITKDGWILDISMMDEEPYGTIEDYIADAKTFAEETEGFVEYVKETSNGFIYKLNNEDGEEYNLYYAIEKDNRMIEIEEGLKFTNYSLDEIESMFAAAQSVK
jgi:hypothetical protein